MIILQSLYMSLMQYDKAIQYGKKAVDLARESGESAPLLNALNNLVISYTEQNQTTAAKRLYEEGLSIAIKTSNKAMEAILLNNLCEIAIKEKEYGLLKLYGEKSLALNTELENNGAAAEAMLALSVYYLKAEKFAAAERLALHSLDIAQKINRLESRTLALGMLSSIAFATGKYDKAFDYQSEKTKIEAGVFNESLQEKEAGLRIRYQPNNDETPILTRREREVLVLIAEGLTNNEIAQNFSSRLPPLIRTGKISWQSLQRKIRLH